MDAVHVPYRGGGPATTDTVAGVVDFYVSTWPGVVTLVREGRPAWLRRLGKRIAPAPTSGADACGGCNSCDPGGSA